VTKCPKEPRPRIVRPILESVESFGLRGPSGQDESSPIGDGCQWACPRFREFVACAEGHFHDPCTEVHIARAHPQGGLERTTEYASGLRLSRRP
jgi:hypothetical protein